MTLEFSVKNQLLGMKRVSPIVSDTINYFEATFDFLTTDWDDCAKTAHFSDGTTVYDIILVDDEIQASAGLNLTAGTWDVYVHGNKTGYRVTSNTIHITVDPSGVIDGEPLPEVSLTFSEQLLVAAQQSLYDLAVANGYVGTLEGWLATLLAALVIDTDLSSVSANDDTVPSAKATKAALDGKATAAQGALADTALQVTNVKNYGAVGDGETDDTAAILLALAADSTIFFPAGTYYVSPVVIGVTFALTAGQTLIGAGEDLTIIKCDDTALSPQGQSLFATAADGVTITNMTIDGGGLASIQYMIFGSAGHDNLHVSNVTVINTAANLGAIVAYNGTNDTFENITLYPYVGTLGSETGKAHGLSLVNDTKSAQTAHQIRNLKVYGGYFGLSLWRQKKVTASDMYFYDLGGETAAPAEGINLMNSDDCALTNAIFDGRKDGGLVMYSDDAGERPTNNVVSNFSASNCVLEGLYVTSGRHNVFSNYVVYNCATGAFAEYGTRYGMYVATDVHYCTFVGCRAYGASQPCGFMFDTGANSNTLIACDFTGNKDNSLIDSGTSNTTQQTESYRQLFNHGMVLPNGEYYTGKNTGGTAKEILGVQDTTYIAEGTVVKSAGGGIEFQSAAAATLGYITDAGDWQGRIGRSNPNFLINWYYKSTPVNQHANSGAIASGYVYDNVKRQAGTITIAATYLSYPADAATDHFIEGNALAGKVVTISVMVGDVVISGSETFPTSAGLSDAITLTGFGTAHLGYATGYMYVRFTATDSTRQLQAVYGELGTYSTMANALPPVYSEQLRLCRYTLRPCCGNNIITNVGGGSISIYDTFDPPMRDTPALTLNVSTITVYDGGDKVLSSLSISSSNVNANGVIYSNIAGTWDSAPTSVLIKCNTRNILLASAER